MVARFHYDAAVLRRLLRDQLPADKEEEVAAHVERCATCQSKMESVAEAGISWNDVRRLLNSGSLDTSRSPESATAAEPIGPRDEARVAEFLVPSDCAESMGRFGRFEITEVLGRGGMGVVIRGYDPALARQSAIKVLAPELATNASARRRFSREAKSAAAVVHDHVIPIHTVDEERGLPYLVMPVVEGDSLEQRVARDGPLGVVEILRIGMQIASGLAAAHAQGLVHRDVKPANILLENGVERVVITDFGLARAADDANMTRSGVIAGTPQYMSPEQVRGEDVDHRSDLFSLGSVLYFMSTGHPPFRAKTMMGVLNRIANDKPRPIRKINADIPAWLQTIIDRLLEKDPNQRYPSASEVAELLGQWLAHLQQPDTVPRPAEPAEVPKPSTSMGSGSWRMKLTAIAAGGGAFLFGAILVILQWNKGTIKIDCPRPDVAIRIMEGDEVHDRLTVTPGDDSVRVAAGKYVVEIDGEYDGLTVENNEVAVTRGGTHVVRIVQESKLPDTDGLKLSLERAFTNLGNGVGVPSSSIDKYAKEHGITREQARVRMRQEIDARRDSENPASSTKTAITIRGNSEVLGKLKPGLTVGIRVHALPDEDFRGRVAVISDLSVPAAYANNDREDHEVVVSIEGRPDAINMLKPGLTTDVHIDAFPDIVFHGRILSVSDVSTLDERDQAESRVAEVGQEFDRNRFQAEREKLVSGLVRGAGTRTYTYRDGEVIRGDNEKLFIAFDRVTDRMRVDRQYPSRPAQGEARTLDDVFHSHFIRVPEYDVCATWREKDEQPQPVRIALPWQWTVRQHAPAYPFDIRAVSFIRYGGLWTKPKSLEECVTAIPATFEEYECLTDGLHRYRSVRIAPEGGNLASSRISYWIDESRGYSLVRSRLEFKSPKKPEAPWRIMSESKTTWREVHGVWVPASLEFVEEHNVNAGKPCVSGKMQFEWESVNELIPEKYFSVKDLDVDGPIRDERPVELRQGDVR